jgi:bisphosphoglycerate-independent phosphoglycerate mutase (AlkP superfamily)
MLQLQRRSMGKPWSGWSLSQMSNTGAGHQVVAHGRILKKDGKLTNIDLKQALLKAAAAQRTVRDSANWQPN